MAQATSISVGKLHEAVNAAVAAANKKYPNVKIPNVTEVAYFPCWIVGIPVPDPVYRVLAQEGLGTVAGIAGEIANHLQGAIPEAFAAQGAAAPPPPEPAVYLRGGHVILGRTLSPQVLLNVKQ